MAHLLRNTTRLYVKMAWDWQQQQQQIKKQQQQQQRH